MMGGVLVERTVGDVLPALQINQKGIHSVRDALVKDYDKKLKEFEKWKKDNKVQVIQQ
jgi:prefoldin subunit 2